MVGNWGLCALSTYRGAGLSGGTGVSGKTDGALKPRKRQVQWPECAQPSRRWVKMTSLLPPPRTFRWF